MAKSYLIAQEGPLKGLILTLEEKPEYTLGRDKDTADLVLEDAAVSRKHALIKKTKIGYTVENLSDTNPLLVNGTTIAAPHLLKENDSLKIGETTFTYSSKIPEETAESKGKKAPQEEDSEDKDKKENALSDIVPEEAVEGEAAAAKADQETKEDKEGETLEEETLYDTIFEEGEDKEPLYRTLPEEALVLKVVSGPNVGAEFGLEPNQNYVIGKDSETADIIFNDLSVSKNHARVSVNEEGQAYVEDLGSKNATLVNGKKIKGKIQISSQDLIALGGSVFLVVSGKEPLETIYTPLPKEAEFEEGEEEKAKAAPKVISWKKKIIPVHYLVLASVAAVVLFGLSLAFFSLFKSHKIEIVQKDYAEEIQDALAEFEAVRFSFNPAMYKLFLTGHVLTTIEQEELLYKLKGLNFIENIENTIVIDELVWKNMNDLLLSYPAFRSVSIHSPEAGLFVVKGYVGTIEDAQNLSDYLNANFPYLDKLKNETVIEVVLKTEIGSQLIAHGLSNISFELASGELILAGRYGTDETNNFKKIIKYLKKQDGIRIIKNIAIETTPDMARIDLTSKYNVTGVISSDNENVSIVIKNKILNPGDYIDDMKVMEIKLNTIYLEKDGLKYKINYKR